MSDAAEKNYLPRDGAITMYTTSWCSDCARAKWFFDNYGVAYTEIDIEQHPPAAAVVMRLNNGRRRVPTIIFADGSILVEPSTPQPADKLEMSL